ncbi:MAG: DUF1801 domain-containing protein [Promicromonosporaceae bacterium]|nr:DUF1801 domain-containing protein [Promicromonosporaceae bacterium]
MPTTWTDVDPTAVVAEVTNARRRRDAETLLELMGEITGEKPRMFGPSIIGFGEYHYRYPSGHSGVAPAASFAARSNACVVYLPDFLDRHQEALEKLGPSKVGKGCLYLSDLAQNDLDVLKEVIRASYEAVTAAPE